MYLYDSAVGHFMSVEHRRIAELIREYDPDLDLLWVPPSEREVNDLYCFAIRHTMNGQAYIAFTLREDEVNHTILTRLFSKDLAHTDVLKTLEAENRAVKLYNNKVRQEKYEELRERAAAVLSSPKSRYRMDGVTYGH